MPAVYDATSKLGSIATPDNLIEHDTVIPRHWETKDAGTTPGDTVTCTGNPQNTSRKDGVFSPELHLFSACPH